MAMLMILIDGVIAGTCVLHEGPLKLLKEISFDWTGSSESSSAPIYRPSICCFPRLTLPLIVPPNTRFNVNPNRVRISLFPPIHRPVSYSALWIGVLRPAFNRQFTGVIKNSWSSKIPCTVLQQGSLRNVTNTCHHNYDTAIIAFICSSFKFWSIVSTPRHNARTVSIQTMVLLLIRTLVKYESYTVTKLGWIHQMFLSSTYVLQN